jgi:REP element-mobilizing transposase RayT
VQPLVIAYHLIWTAYGWWLPNDLRGSTSRVICSDIIAELGALHYGRKRVQPSGSLIHDFYEAAKAKLKYPLMTFGSDETLVIADAFSRVIQRMIYTCYACAIMPEHIHLVIRKHKHSAEEMIANFQRESHLLLRERDTIDLEHPVWGGHGWKVFLDEPSDIWRTNEYVRENPVKIGLPIQEYSFVMPYDNWPLHEGHNPNSPYAKRLRGR